MNKLEDLLARSPWRKKSLEKRLYQGLQDKKPNSHTDTRDHIQPKPTDSETQGFQAVATHHNMKKQDPENHAAAEQQRAEKKFTLCRRAVPDQVHPGGQHCH